MAKKTDTGRRRHWAVTAALVLGVVAVCGLASSVLLFSSWSEVRTTTSAEAERAVEEARAEAGGGAPYIEISASGKVSVRRELERDSPVRPETLHMLTWEPGNRRLLRIGFPFWFVRMKMTANWNLGTVTAALAGDWENLNLDVTEDDLERRGPGLVLDHVREDGARILLWTD